MVPQILPVSNPTSSYWLSQPSKHANLRSTSAFPESCDIAIIGSGLSGILTAYHILQAASRSTPTNIPKVVIVEARDLCSGATARNGGHCKVKTATLLGMQGIEADELQALVAANQEDIRRIAEDEDIECEMEVRRSFDVFVDEDEARELKEKYIKAKTEGRKWTQNYTRVPEEFVEQITSIKGAKCAFSVPVVSLWPYKFVAGVLSRLLERFPEYLNVQTNTPVTSLSNTSSYSKSTETTVSTPRGSLKATKIVLATNAYTSGLLPQFLQAITPIRGMATHITPSVPIHPHLNNTYSIHFHPFNVDYLNPRPDGSIVVGGGGQHYRDDRSLWYNNFDDHTPWAPSIASHWDAYMGRSFLGWEESGEVVESVWVGIMGLTPDGKPHVGRVPGIETAWMLAGFNGGGNGIIGVCARAVAEMVRLNLGFEDVAENFGVPRSFATSEERMMQGKSGV